MNPNLKADAERIDDLLEKIRQHAVSFSKNIRQIPTYSKASPVCKKHMLYKQGIGGESVLEEFMQLYCQGIISSAGPRYYGFVTGGTTPAALMGDWLVSLFDQNATAKDGSTASIIEEESISLLKQLFNLPESFFGTFVTGATMANFVGLAIGRQWIAQRAGVDLAQRGLYNLPPIKVLSATPHSSIIKALAMLGLGRDSLQYIPTIEGREAINIEALENELKQMQMQKIPCIVVANAGTVNTVDFDNLADMAILKQRYDFFLHVDGAFGGVAACSPLYREFLKGMELADTITIDAHKWLNVPYDCAMQFTKHPNLQLQVFQNSASYLGDISGTPDFIHFTPENSRRFRALPVWFTLKAYGADGYREIIERNCHLAKVLSDKIRKSDNFILLSDTNLNVVCFTIMFNGQKASIEQIQKFLSRINNEAKAFFTQTIYKGNPGIRAAICNWQTEEPDIEMAWETLMRNY